jgi:membrane protein implicated in regulation of membrane protease activity
MDLPAWAIWVVIAVAMLAVEATTSSFFTVYFGIAAAITTLLAVAGLPAAVQIIAFGLLGVGGLVLTRPALMRMAGANTPAVATGVDAMRGRIGVVTQPIGELEAGQVKVGGETWSARSYFEHEPIAQGTRVEVVEVKGVTALVIAAPSDRTELPKET